MIARARASDGEAVIGRDYRDRRAGGEGRRSQGSLQLEELARTEATNCDVIISCIDRIEQLMIQLLVVEGTT